MNVSLEKLIKQKLKETTYASSMGIGERHFSDHHIEAITAALLPLIIEEISRRSVWQHQPSNN